MATGSLGSSQKASFITTSVFKPNYLQAIRHTKRVAGSASVTVFPILGHHISIDHIPSL